MRTASSMTIDPRRIRPLRRVEYDRMVATGMFADEKIELIDGALVQMSPEGPHHSETIHRLMILLVRGLPETLIVRVGNPWAANDISEPEPDLAIVPAGPYFREHPADAVLLIEVANSSRQFDLGRKAQLYAEAAVPEYWVVDIRDRCVHVHTDPTARGYGTRTRHGTDATVDAAGVHVVVADLFDQVESSPS